MFVLLFERSMCIFDIYEYLRFLLQTCLLGDCEVRVAE
jgi:hypothetical protein